MGKEIKICPKCKKPTLKQATNVSGWLDRSVYICKDPSCGYSGRFYIIIDPDELERIDSEEEGKPDGE